MCYIPVDIFPKRHLYHWPDDTYVIPEYSFGFECKEEIVLSQEHIDCVWLNYNEKQDVPRLPDGQAGSTYFFQWELQSPTETLHDGAGPLIE